jgi:diguanylate cyclase (GGDEF)-like protein
MEDALTAARRLLDEAVQRRDAGAHAGCCLLIGECCLHLGRIDEALEHAQAAARMFKHLEDPASESRARSLSAWVLLTRADSEQALDEVLAALELATSTGDEDARAFALDVTGMVYWLIQQPTKAVGFFEDAIRLATQTGDDVQLGRFLINLGGVQAEIGLHAQNRGDAAEFNAMTRLAIETASQGLAISRRVGDLWSLRIALCNMAEHCCRLGEYAAAQIHLAEHDLLPGPLDNRAAVHYQFTQGIVLAGLGRFDDAIARFQDSLAAEQDGDIEQTVTSMLHISKAYESAGRFAEALLSYKKYHALQMKMAEQEVQRRARYVALRFENEKLRALAATEQHRARNLETENLDLVRETDRLSRAVLEDTLTALSNRRHLELALSEMLVSGERYAIAMLDVDHFKQINDTFCHSTGDGVLREIGRLIRQCCREQDLPVRYGGEEFAVLMRGTEQGDARKICDRMKAAIEHHDWRNLLEDVGVTVSIGAASWSEACTPEDTLSLADQRMYRAKAEGRNRVVDTTP